MKNVNPLRSGVPEKTRIVFRNLRSMAARLATFQTWPHSAPKAEDLAEAGFYSTCESDKVICFECDVGLDHWEPSDDPWLEHLKFSKDCDFLARGDNKRILIERLRRRAVA